MTAVPLVELAATALAAWGADMAPRLISHRENAVFSVDLPHGRAALRLHRPGYNSAGEIATELWWTDALAAHGFPVPKPIAATNGACLVHLADGRIATMIDWVNGAPIGSADQPLAGTIMQQKAIYRDLGKLLARLHSISDGLALPDDFQRRRWDINGFLGPAPLWGRFWQNPALAGGARELIATARRAALSDLADYESSGADTGLIHADALRENVFSTNGHLTLIDFDDSGFGFRLYDLATAVSQSIDDAAYPHLCEALLDGYDQVRGIGQKDADRLPLFAMLRCFASLGWAIGRIRADSSDMVKYARRATGAARQYLDR